MYHPTPDLLVILDRVSTPVDSHDQLLIQAAAIAWQADLALNAPVVFEGARADLIKVLAGLDLDTTELPPKFIGDPKKFVYENPNECIYVGPSEIWRWQIDFASNPYLAQLALDGERSSEDEQRIERPFRDRVSDWAYDTAQTLRHQTLLEPVGRYQTTPVPPERRAPVVSLNELMDHASVRQFGDPRSSRQWSIAIDAMAHIARGWRDMGGHNPQVFQLNEAEGRPSVFTTFLGQAALFASSLEDNLGQDALGAAALLRELGQSPELFTPEPGAGKHRRFGGLAG